MTTWGCTVVTFDESRVLGCVYLYSTHKAGYDAVVYLWARQSELASGLEERLFEAVKAWVAAAWPFQQVAFPDRDVDWETWCNLPTVSQ